MSIDISEDDKRNLRYILLFCAILSLINILSNQVIGHIGITEFINLFALKAEITPHIGYLTYIFIHIETYHLAVNLLLLILSFSIATHYSNPKKVFTIFLISGLLSGLIFSFVSDITNHNVPVVGASGGVFAILANCLIFNVRVDRFKSIAVYSLMPLLLISIELSRAFIFEHPMIVSDNRLINLIHISGVLTGYILVVVSLPSDE